MLDRWFEAKKASGKISPKSAERYEEIITRHLQPNIGATQLTKLKSADIKAFYASLATGGRHDGKDGGLSPASRRYVHVVLRAALQDAVEDKIIPDNQATLASKALPKIEQHDVKVLDANESATLLGALAGNWLYWPVLIALATGARRGEILALKWRSVDWATSTLRISESLEQTNAGLRTKLPKSGKARTITLPAFLIDRLREKKIQQAETLLAVGVRQTPDTLVCCAEDGAPYLPRSLTHAFSREISRLKDFPRIHFHSLRHSHATQVLRLGTDIKTLQQRLGHSSATVTLAIYAQSLPEAQKELADKLDAGLGNAISGALRAK